MNFAVMDTLRHAHQHYVGAPTRRLFALVAILCVITLPLTAQNAVPSGNPVTVSFNGNVATFNASYVDSAGAGDIRAADLWVTSSVPGNPGSAAKACVVEWRNTGGLGQFFLVNDAGNAFSSYGIGVGLGGPAGGQQVRVANSQCAVRSEGSNMSMSGQTLNLAIEINFDGSPMAQAGQPTYGLFMIAEDGQGRWSTNFTTRFGQTNLPTNELEACYSTAFNCTVSASPQSGLNTTFTVNYYDQNGVAELNDTVLHIMNHAPGSIAGWSAHECVIQYNLHPSPPQVPQIQVTADAGGSFNGTTSNSQCSVNLLSVQNSGTSLTLQIAVQFSSSFASTGTQNLYLEADRIKGNMLANNLNFQVVAGTYLP